MATKVDYKTLEREYVTGADSLRALARREGISNSTISEQARKGGWEEKRSRFQLEVSNRTIQRDAEDFTARIGRLKNRSLSVFEAMLVRFAEQLARKDDPMFVTEKGIDMAFHNIMLISGEATERTESRVLGLNVNTNVSPELFVELERLARGRLAGGSVEGTAELEPAGSSTD